MPPLIILPAWALTPKALALIEAKVKKHLAETNDYRCLADLNLPKHLEMLRTVVKD